MTIRQQQKMVDSALCERVYEVTLITLAVAIYSERTMGGRVNSLRPVAIRPTGKHNFYTVKI